MNEHPDGGTSQAGKRPRPQWLIPAVVVVVLAVLGGVVYAMTRDNATTTPSATSPSAPGSVQPSAGATPTTSATPPPIPEMTPIRPTVQVTQENEVRVSLTKVESVQGEARLPGEIAGPAIRVTVRVQNGASKALNLGNARVTAYYGADETPAGVLTAGSRELTGKLAPGDSAEGVYLFTVPTEDRGNVRITVDTAAGVPVAVFTGKMG